MRRLPTAAPLRLPDMLLGSTVVCLLPLQEQLEREARCTAFPANYFHARQILQQPPTPNCPHLGHIERVIGPAASGGRGDASVCSCFSCCCARGFVHCGSPAEEGWWAVVETRRAISCRASWTRYQSVFFASAGRPPMWAGSPLCCVSRGDLRFSCACLQTW